MKKYMTSILMAFVTLFLVSSSFAKSPGMPEEPSAMTTPSATQGQTINQPTLPSVTETKDKQGNAILSSDPTKNVKVETLVKKELSQEEKDFNRGYVRGVAAAFMTPSLIGDKARIEKYTQIEIPPEVTAKYKEGISSGFLAGLIISDTFSIKADVPTP